MRRLVLGAVALLVLSVTAGCIGGNKAVLPETGPTLPVTHWLLDGAGNALTAEAFGAELPAFEFLHVSDRLSGEPTLGVTRKGGVFYASIDFDVVGGLPSTVYYRSTDGGKTWVDKSPRMAGVKTHPTSFDPYVYVDPTTGRVFAMDMGPHVLCNKVSWSDDEGETWTTRDGACIPGVNDHPTIFAGPAMPWTAKSLYPNQVYLCVNQVTDSVCYQSPDGGLSWLQTAPAFLGFEPTRVVLNTTSPEGLVSGALNGLCGGLHGHGHASWADGTLYLGRAWCGDVSVAVSRDGGLTWQRKTISGDPIHRPADHDVSIGTDREGKAYAFWVGRGGRSVFLSVSSDRGDTWSKPLDVTPPHLTAVKLPSLVAGEAGRVAFLFVGSDNPKGFRVDARKQGCNNAGNPDCYQYPDDYKNATWHGFVGVSLNANTAAPVFAITQANPVDAPLKRGGCRDRCAGMYDFLDIDIDPRTGEVWAAFVDVCSAECDDPGVGTFDATQDPVGKVARLIAGPRLLDAPIAAR